jgi:hypothetical protein
MFLLLSPDSVCQPQSRTARRPPGRFSVDAPGDCDLENWNSDDQKDLDRVIVNRFANRGLVMVP